MNINSSSYLELMKIILTDYHPFKQTEYHPLEKVKQTWKISLVNQIDKVFRTRNFAICKMKTVLPEIRANGYDWPANAYTMVGINRLTNIEMCIRSIINNKTTGDLVETGVWRGGAVIFMKAVLNELAVYDRKIWAADSFKGLPMLNKLYAADEQNKLYLENILIASLEEVKNNFNRFGLLVSSINFLVGIFSETLPNTSIDKIALLRLDCDMYESNIIALTNLYLKVSKGGFIIIDDFNSFKECKIAVNDFRKQHGIIERIIEIDNEAVYWQKN